MKLLPCPLCGGFAVNYPQPLTGRKSNIACDGGGITDGGEDRLSCGLVLYAREGESMAELAERWKRIGNGATPR